MPSPMRRNSQPRRSSPDVNDFWTPGTPSTGVRRGFLRAQPRRTRPLGGGAAASGSPYGSPNGSRARGLFRRQLSCAMTRQRSGPSSFKDPTEEFTFAQLEAATKGFVLEAKIGEGSFGTMYRGKLPDGREVAIKRGESGPRARRFQEKESAFRSELVFLSRLHHKHLVGLVGYCEEAEERLLVFEYMKNGALYDHLHPKASAAAVHNVSHPLLKSLGVKNLPAVIGRTVNGEELLLKDGISVKDLRSGVKELKTLLDSCEKKNNKVLSNLANKKPSGQWEEIKKIPLLTASNFEEICGEKTPVCIIGVFGSNKAKGQLEAVLSEISKKTLIRGQNYNSRNVVSYALLDKYKQSAFLSSFDKSGYSGIAEKSMDKFAALISSFRYPSPRASGLRAPLKDVKNTLSVRSILKAPEKGTFRRTAKKTGLGPELEF
ncbi:DnaJ protein ERDJ3A [Zea mays]|uniref:DnaJ protein ERDJ3A n=2 Tax=Zea mays TaxID=4577 RepID=A0A8J8XPF5_MAIZE|nr:DnaJ protein ERDJ3A [Zea mays]PWZ21269.1 DnaJ protein ERDJ3A [Zea mays]